MTDHEDREHHRIEAVYDAYDGGAVGRWDPSQPGNAAILAERARIVEGLLGGISNPRRTFELGCGWGEVLESLPVGGGPRFGVDVLGHRLEKASVTRPHLQLIRANGAALPLTSGSMDLVAAFTVFSSVLDDGVRTAMAVELDRVLRPGGRLLWYDMRRANPSNPDTRPVSRGELRSLFPGWARDLRTTTVLPPLARRLGPGTDLLYPMLTRLSPLRTHIIGVLTRPG